MEDNYLPRIIAFSGRKQSGKTELAKICLEYNYEMINFADPMKNLICKILNITRDELEETKDKIQDIIITNEMLQILMSETQINYEIFLNMKTEFKSIREIMQIFGTDIIRENNPNWHIERIKREMNEKKRYCFGDTRFNNEKKFLESLGAECWFIIRPSNFNISNHISETELTWKDFNRNVIINKDNLEKLKTKWRKYMELHLNNNFNYFMENNVKNIRNKLIFLLNNYERREIIKMTKLRNGQINWICKKLLIVIFEEYKSDINLYHSCTHKNEYLYGMLRASGYIKKEKSNIFIYFENKDRDIVKEFVQKSRIREKIRKNKKTNHFYIECKNEFIIENLKKCGINRLKEFE